MLPQLTLLSLIPLDPLLLNMMEQNALPLVGDSKYLMLERVMKHQNHTFSQQLLSLPVIETSNYKTDMLVLQQSTNHMQILCLKQ